LHFIPPLVARSAPVFIADANIIIANSGIQSRDYYINASFIAVFAKNAKRVSMLICGHENRRLAQKMRHYKPILALHGWVATKS